MKLIAETLRTKKDRLINQDNKDYLDL